jgi:hypothetical protein
MQCYTVYFIWKLLNMFRVIPPPIIRSACNCIYSIWYLSHRYCYLPLSWKSPNSSTKVADGNNGVTNARCCMRSWWRVEVPPETCWAVCRYNKLCNVPYCWIYIGLFLQCTDTWTLNLIFLPSKHVGAVGWGTALQAGRSQVRFPIASFEFFIDNNTSGRTVPLGLTQPLTELSKKGKVMPSQAWTGPEGSRRFRIPDFKTISTWRW